jgi:hypothetical protein
MMNPLASSPLFDVEEMRGSHPLEVVAPYKSCKNGEGLMTYKLLIELRFNGL